MKRTIIGGILVLTGTIISLCIIITAAAVVPSVTTWSGSKLWYTIFGDKYGNGESQSLFMGFPFAVGIILFLIGLFILGVEYFKKDS